MSTVVSAPAVVNSASAPLAGTYAAPSMAQVWAALGYIAGKEGSRDDLTDGAIHSIDLSVSGSIDGCEVSERIVGNLTVGHASEKASSTLPNVSHILAAVFGRLNKATRAKAMRDILADYAANGQGLPELSVGELAEVENFLAALRQTKRATARGAVKANYSLHGAAATDRPAVAGRIGR